MIKAIDEQSCIGCGLCEDVCPVDVLRRSNDGKVYIAYPEDCYFCWACISICPTDAIIYGPGVPKKLNRAHRWELIKAALKVNEPSQ